MIINPAKVLRGVAADLHAERPRLTVGNIFDHAVQKIVEDGNDWRDLTAKRSSAAMEAAE